MKLIERSEIDTKKWDALVLRDERASFFSYSWYLDALAENWCVMVNEEYSKGIALPYTKRLGIQVLYTPVFSRAVHSFGSLKKEGLNDIRKRFPVIELGVTSKIWEMASERVHQVINEFENRKISSQAKRSLKKAVNSGVSVTGNESYETIFSAIQEELEGKFSGVNEHQLSRLKKLITAADQNGFLKVIEVSDGNQTGGILCLEDASQVLYLKGACPENLKKNGGMYMALNTAIEYAEASGKSFDFGGSNVEGVKRFNKNLGGVDQVYAYHEFNCAPFWFNWARKIKNRSRR